MAIKYRGARKLEAESLVVERLRIMTEPYPASELVEDLKREGFTEDEARWAVLHLIDLRQVSASADWRLGLVPS